MHIRREKDKLNDIKYEYKDSVHATSSFYTVLLQVPFIPFYWKFLLYRSTTSSFYTVLLHVFSYRCAANSGSSVFPLWTKKKNQKAGA